MSTSGAVGFIKNGNLITLYNGWDSYPSGLGNDVLNFIRGRGIKEIENMINNFSIIDASTNESFFYSIDKLYNGSNDKLMIEDATTFLYDSLFCEWAYIINLDTQELEIYRGGNKEKPLGRFKEIPMADSGYYAVTFVKSLPLDDLPYRLNI